MPGTPPSRGRGATPRPCRHRPWLRPSASTVERRFAFYNNSAFDDRTKVVHPDDDDETDHAAVDDELLELLALDLAA